MRVNNLSVSGALLALTMLLSISCVRVKLEPVRIDATVTIRVERELENFFDDLDSQSSMLRVDEASRNKAPKQDSGNAN
jgi:hypothetical protein